MLFTHSVNIWLANYSGGNYKQYLNTVTIWIPDKSKRVQLSNSLVFGWWSENKKCLVFWSRMSGFLMVCQINWSDHLESGQKSVQKVKCSEVRCLVFRYIVAVQNPKFLMLRFPMVSFSNVWGYNSPPTYCKWNWNIKSKMANKFWTKWQQYFVTIWKRNHSKSELRSTIWNLKVFIIRASTV